VVIFLFKHVWVLEVVLELGGSLDSCVADLADFVGVEFVPLLFVELFVEVDDEFGVDEVHKSVANIAIILN